MLSNKVKAAIERLHSISPNARKFTDSFADHLQSNHDMVEALTSVSETLETVVDEGNIDLLEDNVKLKELIIQMSKNAEAMEQAIDDMATELEELREATGDNTEVSAQFEHDIGEFITSSSCSYLLSVYNKRDVLIGMRKPARTVICTLLVDKFKDTNNGPRIPKIWYDVIASNGEV